MGVEDLEERLGYERLGIGLEDERMGIGLRLEFNRLGSGLEARGLTEGGEGAEVLLVRVGEEFLGGMVMSIGSVLEFVVTSSAGEEETSTLSLMVTSETE